jgi:hypothetical protein
MGVMHPRRPGNGRAGRSTPKHVKAATLWRHRGLYYHTIDMHTVRSVCSWCRIWRLEPQNRFFFHLGPGLRYETSWSRDKCRPPHGENAGLSTDSSPRIGTGGNFFRHTQIRHSYVSLTSKIALFRRGTGIRTPDLLVPNNFQVPVLSKKGRF